MASSSGCGIGASPGPVDGCLRALSGSARRCKTRRYRRLILSTDIHLEPYEVMEIYAMADYRSMFNLEKQLDE
jgi:hypothetical protein